MELVTLLEANAGAILAESMEAMGRAHLSHYEASPPAEVRTRLQALYDTLLAGLRRRDLSHVLEYAESIARERYAAGFPLGEVQTAFNVLEEAVWKWITTRLEPAQQAESLALVSTVLGAGKDRLAQTWVSLATSTQAPALDMAALFRGTEGV
jgi:hypothetical protein